MPKRNTIETAASHAEHIGADPGSRDLPYDGPGSAALDLLKSLALDPLGIGQGSLSHPAAVNMSAKPLREMLGEIVKPAYGSELPRRMRVTSISPDENKVMMHGIGQGSRPVESTMDEFNQLHNAGAILREGPPTEGLSVQALIKRLLSMVRE